MTPTPIYSRATGQLLGHLRQTLSPYADTYQFPVGNAWIRLVRAAYLEVGYVRSDALWVYDGSHPEHLAQLEGWEPAPQSAVPEGVRRELCDPAPPDPLMAQTPGFRPRHARPDPTLRKLQTEVPGWVPRLK